MKRLIQNKKSAAKLRQKKKSEYTNVKEQVLILQKEIEKQQRESKEK